MLLSKSIGINPFILLNLNGLFFIVFILNRYQINLKSLIKKFDGKKFLFCFLAYFILFLLLAFLFKTEKKVPQDIDVLVSKYLGLTMVVHTCILGPIIEELLFREVLYIDIKKILSPIFSLILVNVLFAISHWDSPFFYKCFYLYIISWCIIFYHENLYRKISYISHHISYNE